MWNSPRLPDCAPDAPASPVEASLRPPGADVAAHFPVQETEALRHDVADVGEAEQHQGDPQDGVEDGDHLPPLRLRRDVPIACTATRNNKNSTKPGSMVSTLAPVWIEMW